MVHYFRLIGNPVDADIIRQVFLKLPEHGIHIFSVSDDIVAFPHFGGKHQAFFPVVGDIVVRLRIFPYHFRYVFQADMIALHVRIDNLLFNVFFGQIGAFYMNRDDHVLVVNFACCCNKTFGNQRLIEVENTDAVSSQFFFFDVNTNLFLLCPVTPQIGYRFDGTELSFQYLQLFFELTIGFCIGLKGDKQCRCVAKVIVGY
ncbi:hypothetical protein SDC9_108067 [bioreactor metagenome]|uniref:Uncharacterized protein n=1 Tax=bioreactor metagenome TaxID=1076179 RepID=A0A645B6Z3_9ZZZZ